MSPLSLKVLSTVVLMVVLQCSGHVYDIVTHVLLECNGHVYDIITHVLLECNGHVYDITISNTCVVTV